MRRLDEACPISSTKRPLPMSTTVALPALDNTVGLRIIIRRLVLTSISGGCTISVSCMLGCFIVVFMRSQLTRHVFLTELQQRKRSFKFSRVILLTSNQTMGSCVGTSVLLLWCELLSLCATRTPVYTKIFIQNYRKDSWILKTLVNTFILSVYKSSNYDGYPGIGRSCMGARYPPPRVRSYDVLFHSDHPLRKSCLSLYDNVLEQEGRSECVTVPAISSYWLGTRCLSCWV